MQPRMTIGKSALPFPLHGFFLLIPQERTNLPPMTMRWTGTQSLMGPRDSNILLVLHFKLTSQKQMTLEVNTANIYALQ